MLQDETVVKTTKVLLTALVFGAFVLLMYKLRNVVFWLAIGGFLAIIINPAVDRLTRALPGHRRSVAAGLMIAAVIVGLVILGIILVPAMGRQISTFVVSVPDTVDQVTNTIQTSNHPAFRLMREYNVSEYIRAHEGDISSAASTFFIKSLQNAGQTLSSIAAFFTIFAMAMYMSVNGPDYIKRLKKLIPKHYHDDTVDLMDRMYDATTGYVNGNLLTSAVAAFTSGLAALIVGLPYPLLLGIIVGLLDLIPMIGASLGAVIVVVVSIFVSWKAALIMLVFFIVYQQFENYVLQPRIMSKTVQMSSFAVFVSALCGAVLAGLLGALVAIPVGACIIMLLQYFFPFLKEKAIAARNKSDS